MMNENQWKEHLDAELEAHFGPKDEIVAGCNLCTMTFSNKNNSVFSFQLDRHRVWHATARIQGRNTTQGIVEWVEL